MRKELAGSQDSYTLVDLFRSTTMRLMTISLSAVWYGDDPPARTAKKRGHVTRRLALKVFHQLRLLRPGHGPAKVRSGHLPDPGDFRSGGHPRQSRHNGDHEPVGTPPVAVRGAHHRRGHDPGEPAGASWYV